MLATIPRDYNIAFLLTMETHFFTGHLLPKSNHFCFNEVGEGAQDNGYTWCFERARELAAKRLENAVTARISFKSKRSPQHTQVCMPKPRNDQQINKQDTGRKNKSPSWYSHSHDMHGKL
jgi:hypothetical protein